MKLLDKTLLALFVTSVIAIGGSGAIQYKLTKSKIESRVDKKLLKEKRLIREQLKDLKPEVGFSYNTERSNVRFIEENTQNCSDSLFNGIKLDTDGERISYRILKTCIDLEGRVFRVEIKKENEETANFIGSLFFIHFIILLIVILVFVLFKFFFLRNIWAPFFSTLEAIKHNEFHDDKVNFELNTGTKEFDELNVELQLLSDKIFEQYQAQKSFTENASHELMTPIAVIRNKLELLIQSETLTNNELSLIGDVLPKLDRLAKINTSLILLSKISNHHFDESEEVNLLNEFDDVLNYFEDQIRSKKIVVRKLVSNPIIVKMHPDLAHVLIMNLVKNAVHHNLTNGTLTLKLEDNYFVLENTGNPLTVNSVDLFGRFSTNSGKKESIGLGLALIKDICGLYGIKLSYKETRGLHSLMLGFDSIKIER